MSFSKVTWQMGQNCNQNSSYIAFTHNYRKPSVRVKTKLVILLTLSQDVQIISQWRSAQSAGPLLATTRQDFISSFKKIAQKCSSNIFTFPSTMKFQTTHPNLVACCSLVYIESHFHFQCHLKCRVSLVHY